MKLVLALPLLVGLVSAAALPYQAVSVPSARSRARPHRGSTAPQQQQRYSAETVNLYNELFEAGRKQLDSDDPQGALPHFRKAASLAPDNSNAHANVGICLMRLGQTEDAIEAFERSEKQDPRQKVAVLKRAQLLDELGRIDEARQGFKRLMRLDPSDPWSYYHLAEYAAASAADSRERAEAPELYEQCVSRFQAKLQQMTLPAQSKQRGHFLETKGKCLMKLDRVDEALAELDAAIKFGNSFAHITRADFLGSQDRMLEAAEEYNKAIEALGASLQLHIALGGVYFAVAKPFIAKEQSSATAAATAATAATAAEKRPHPLSSEEKQAYLRKAIEQFDLALAVDPQHGKALWSKGKALLALGEHERAQETFEAGAVVGAWPNKWQHLSPETIAGVARYDPSIKSRPNWTGDPIVEAAVAKLQQNFQVILTELKSSLPDYNPAVAGKDSDSLWSNKNSADLVDRGNWMMLYMRQAHRRSIGCEVMPRTCRIVEDMELQGLLGVSKFPVDDELAAIGESHTIFFSGLRGDTHVTAHCGPHNRRMRILFPMIIPDGGNYTMRLTDEYLHYEPGKAIVFDDSFQHEVWAQAPPGSNEPRVILILDVVHPALR